MSRNISIMCGGTTAEASLNESATADKVWNALPIETRANTWGEEIYFAIPVEADEEESRASVAPGDIAYWPPGKAFCIFFGRTPASVGNEIRPASPVNVIGCLTCDPLLFRNTVTGMKIRLSKLE